MSNDRKITRELPTSVAKVLDRFEAFIYSTRWSLLFVNLGLIAALLIYLARFAIDDYNVLSHGLSESTEDVRVLLLGLVDTALVATLLIMIIQGSHQIFIRRFHVDAADRPQWLDHIDSGILKVKVALSIAGITLIDILKDFVHLENVKWELVEHRMIVHGVCLISAFVIALIWRVTHPSGDNHTAHAVSTPTQGHASEHTPTANPGNREVAATGHGNEIVDATSHAAAASSHSGH